MLTVESSEILEFLHMWHEAGRKKFARFSALDYDEYRPKRAVERRKYIALDYGPPCNWSGEFLVDRSTGIVYNCKSYGVPRYRLGTLAEVTKRFANNSVRESSGF